MNIYTYGSYLKNGISTITFEECIELHGEIAKEAGNDPTAGDLYGELYAKAVQYANMRARWAMMTSVQRAEEDSRRTSMHDSLIAKCNQLARYLKMNGKDASWRDRLGYEEDDPLNRKRIGDFACYLAFSGALAMR